MKKTVLVILGLLLAVLQYTLTWRFQLGWHNYGLALCAVIVLTSFDMQSGLICGGVCGFFIDCIQGRIFGINIVILLLSALLTGFLARRMNGKNLITVIVLTFMVTFISEFLQYWLYLALNGSGNIAFALTKIIFPQSFINVVCAIPVYMIFKFLWKKMKMQRDRWGY